MSRYQIRKARLGDVFKLEEHYNHMLHYLAAQDYIIMPTRENVKVFTQTIMIPALEEGRGIWVAEHLGEVIGSLFWIKDKSPFTTRFSSATSFGQFVVPEHRGMSVVPLMAAKAAEDLKQMGTTRVFDFVHTKEAKEAAEACNFKVVENIVSLLLNDSQFPMQGVSSHASSDSLDSPAGSQQHPSS